MKTKTNSKLLESDIVGAVRLALQRMRCTTWRNNVGMLRNERGGWVRFGLCEGSSDFIGFTEYTVKPEDVGRNIAVFTAIETKRPKGGSLTEEQETFINRVKQAGGIAGAARTPLEATELIQEFKK